MVMTLERISMSELASLFKARKSIYQLLHVLFSEPLTVEMYQQICKHGNTVGLRDLNELMEGGCQLLRFFSKGHIEDALLQAQEEYTRLFIGPNAVPAPPWESMYRGSETFLFDNPVFELRNLYYRFGHQAINPSRESDDHIVQELEFMLFLIEQSLNANERILPELLEGQQIMLNQHLGKWVPQFAADIKQNTTCKLYVGAAKLLKSLVAFDCKLINELQTN